MNIKLLYLIPSLVNSGGMERVLTEKVNFLVNTGDFEITILTTDMSEEENSFFYLSDKIELIKLPLYYKNYFNLNFFNKMVKIHSLNSIYKKNIIELFLKKEFDICITMGGKELEFITDLNLRSKVIYESHFNKNFRSSFLKANNKKNLFWNIFGRLRDWQHTMQAKKVDKIVVLTDDNLKSWSSVTNNVIKIVNPSPLKNVNSQRPMLCSKRVIAIGKLDNQKGFDMLIDAWSIVNNNYSDWRLDIFGTGSLEEKLQNQIYNLNLSNVVSLAGVTNNVMDELLASSFLVLSSRFEGLPMVLIESITCGLPIVSFDCETGPREIISSNDCGLLIPNGDIKELAKGIIRLIENPQILSNMSDQAIIKSSNYELNKIMEKWISLFNQITLK